MTSLFEDLQEGLQQAIDYANGRGPAKVTSYAIQPVQKLSNDEIKAVRHQAQMTQLVFADYMGVSVKTVEAWECGRSHPSGSAYRLMSILSSDKASSLPFVEVR